MSIEAWVTDPAGTYIAHLDRSEASPFRGFAIAVELNRPGVGSLEYHLDNALVVAHDDLFAYGNLVWFRYRGKTRAWIVEQRDTVLDEAEHATDWVRVAGRGALQLLGDRTIWPTHYSDANSDPSQWGFGGWSTKTDAPAAAGQKVVPVVSTTVGSGATIGDPVEIVGGGNRQIGIISAIDAGVSVTLQDNLAYTFPTGSRIRSAATQWRRFVNRAAGEMLWDCINESNARFVADGGPAIVRGTVATTGADGWTQDFRFDNLLEVVDAVTDVYGDVEMDGLTYNYRNAQGTDRRATVIFEEGADILALEVSDSDRDSVSWVVAEGTGHAVFSYLAPKAKLTRAQRRTLARRTAAQRRKAPAAPRKVVEIRADYPIDLAVEAVHIARRREAYIDAKDVSSLVMLDSLADAALEEHQVEEAVGLQVSEVRYKVDVDYGLGDWVRAIVPSRGFDEDVRIVALVLVEDEDVESGMRVDIEVNTARQDHLLQLASGARDTRRSLGVQNRQPQGQLVPFGFSGQGVFDTDDTLEVHLYIPDRMYVTIESRVSIDFRPFFAPAKAAASGGADTSGASSASSSNNSTGHNHVWAVLKTTTGGKTLREYQEGGPGAVQFDLPTDSAAASMSTDQGDSVHSHGIAHTHATPNHTHGLTYGVFKETYPASHDATLKVYELDAGAWTLRATITGLTADSEDIELTSYITGPGQWRLTLQSAAAQPNGGRLGAYLSGYVLGAIQSS